MPGGLEIQVIREECIELYAQHPALSKQGPVTLDRSEEILRSGNIRKDHGFAEHRTALGPSYVEHIAVVRKEWKADIAFFRHQAVTETRPVHK